MQPRNIEGPQRSEEGGERTQWLKLGGWTVLGLAVLWALCVVSWWTVRDIPGAWVGASSRSAVMKDKLRQRRDSPSISSAKVCLHAHCVWFAVLNRHESGQFAVRSRSDHAACLARQALALTNVIRRTRTLLLLLRYVCCGCAHHQDTTYMAPCLVNAEMKMCSKFAAQDNTFPCVSGFSRNASRLDCSWVSFQPATVSHQRLVRLLLYMCTLMKARGNR